MALKTEASLFVRLVRWALKQGRSTKVFLQFALDTVSVLIALTAAIFIRFDSLSLTADTRIISLFLLLAALTLTAFFLLGLYKAFLRHVSLEVASTLAKGVLASSISLLILLKTLEVPIPSLVSISYAALLYINVCGTRFILRAAVQHIAKSSRIKLAVYGAGQAGAQTLRSLQTHSLYNVCIIIDDDPELQGKSLYGVVIKDLQSALEACEKEDVKTILLSIPSIPQERKKEIVQKLAEKKLSVKVSPNIQDILDGKASIAELTDLSIEELLGREPVLPDAHLMSKNIKDKTVLITGAGGSIGSEVCRQVAFWKPHTILMLDVSEAALYRIHQTLSHKLNEKPTTRPNLVPLIGSVQDKELINTILNEHEVHIIFHAAAYKHVPLMEENVVECVKNNILGTFNVINSAAKANVQNLVVISTDKAVNPTNIMGATKRVAELICRSIQQSHPSKSYSIVRFGNVLGSSGSVVPLFKKQLTQGGPLTVTDETITRYFMTIPEAAQLVIQASSLARNGEIFVLDMGQPVKIIDLAMNMIRMTGLTPVSNRTAIKKDGEIEIKITGLRPGEKLYEELAYQDNLSSTSHPRILTTEEPKVDSSYLLNKLEDLKTGVSTANKKAIKKDLETLVPSFKTL